MAKREQHSQWKGGRKKSNGYWYIIKPKDYDSPMNKSSRYIPEHRYLMEKKIGRYLNPWEVVHHINRIKTDNRPNNLMLVIDKKHYLFHKNKTIKCPYCEKEFQIR